MTTLGSWTAGKRLRQLLVFVDVVVDGRGRGQRRYVGR